MVTLIFMRIQEIFNVTDAGRDRNFGDDFLFLFFDFYEHGLA